MYKVDVGAEDGDSLGDSYASRAPGGKEENLARVAQAIASVVAEPGALYESDARQQRWVEVLVDCPGVQKKSFDEMPSDEEEQSWEYELKPLTYRVPPELEVQLWDIVSVPYGSQQLSGIAIRFPERLPAELTPERIRDVAAVGAVNFLSTGYRQVLERVAQYYYTPLIQVLRAALPPGLLGRSQHRIRLAPDIGADAAEFLRTQAAREILLLLQAGTGDYTWKHLKSKIKGKSAYSGLRELKKRGLVESYFEPPKPPRPQMKPAVTLASDGFLNDLTSKQLEVLNTLRRHGGELWLKELLEICNVTSSVVNKLQQKGYVTIQEREKLRVPTHPTQLPDQPKDLTIYQKRALEVINNLSGYSQVLLHGVTGSGKTEVYLQAIAPLLNRGLSALVLVPEIGLTPQLTDRFSARFGDRILVYHSALSKGERYDSWRQMLTGEPKIVIGTRSAIFAPLPNLGFIVLDEEYDNSYKQDDFAPTYHARTVAKWRAELANCPLILGAATPSLETWIEMVGEPGSGGVGENDLLANKYYLSLPQRVHARPLPPVEVADMRLELRQGNRSIFSRALQQALLRLHATRQQGILFIHRRGHSTFVSCRSCGYVIECPNCDVSLSYHSTHEGATEVLRCHYCNYSQLHPQRCPECTSPYLRNFGSGTQRVVEELNKEFPQLRAIRFDSDTTRTKGAHRTLLTQFANRQADLLVGTQMLAKGLDLPQVTLVGVVAADGLLNMADYRASERAFQILTQVTGRAGRGSDAGRAIIQTYTPEHPVIAAVQRHEYEPFVEVQLQQRAALNYPPYGRLILLRLSGEDAATVEATAYRLATRLDRCDDASVPTYELLGPAPAPIMRIANRYRWHILLKFPPTVLVKLPDLTELRTLCPSGVSLTIDVDPLNLG